jgi:hypothetical protein
MSENDGNSYFFFTAVVYGLGAVAIAIQQAVDSTASRACFVAFTTVCTLLSSANIVSLFVRIFIGQKIEISPPFLKAETGGRYFFGTPWRILRMIDCLVAHNGSLALILLCFWIYDTAPGKDSYFSYCIEGNICGNIWAAWLVMIMQAVDIYTSSSTLDPYIPLAVLYKTLASSSSYIFEFIVFTTIVVEGYARIQDRQRQEPRELQRLVANTDGLDSGSKEQRHTYQAHLAAAATEGLYRGAESNDGTRRSAAFEF